jgi:hypothetical protein
LADLIGRQPYLLDELLADLLAEKPERAAAVERWIAELDAWDRSRPRLGNMTETLRVFRNP